MSNQKAFFEKADQDPEIHSRFKGIAEGGAEDVFAKLAALSEEIGTPVSAEQFSSVVELLKVSELMEGDLSAVARGAGTNLFQATSDSLSLSVLDAALRQQAKHQSATTTQDRTHICPVDPL